jgi:Rps23 Pro-64 3,4-dihydroxylase Tpa1-like proline 4-hydroxylase
MATVYPTTIQRPPGGAGMQELLSDEFASKLLNLAKANAEKYAAARPFPHIYIDDFLPTQAAEAALRDFPEQRQVKWSEFDTPHEKKLAFDVVEKLPAAVREALYFMNSRPMLEFLEILTGIHGVIPDPYYIGGGLHQIKPGGRLAVHADFNHHSRLNLERRINVLIYLNKDWKEEYGGHFELWNKDMTAAEQKLLPIFNRCAIFSTTSVSYHGHPNPLSCPPDRTRKSLATYYYTNGRPEEELRDSHSTLFVRRPGEVEEAPARFKKVMHAFCPPIVAEAYKKIRG